MIASPTIDDDVVEVDDSLDLSENQDKDKIFHETSESTASPLQHPIDPPSNVMVDVSYLENDHSSTVEVSGNRSKDGMTSIPTDYDTAGSFDNELMTFQFNQYVEEFGNIGNKLD